MKKLFLLTTRGLGNFYVIAPTPNDAQDNLIKLLDEAQYGFSCDRKVTNIQLLSEEIGLNYNGLTYFSSGRNLIIT